MPASPTSHLRFVKRKYKLPLGSRILGTGSQEGTHLVLQQEWRIVRCGKSASVQTEWRDVPIVEEDITEEVNQDDPETLTPVVQG